MSNGIMLTTPGQIEAFQLLRVRAALGIQVKTGMKMSRGSIIQLAASYCGSTKRTARAVYTDYNAWLVEQGFEDKPL